MEKARQLIAENLAERLKDNDVIGIGTGSTVGVVIKAFAKIISEKKLSISAITTSYETALDCSEAGIKPIEGISFNAKLNWGFDGVDEIDDNLSAIKGKGAALLREKVMAKMCRHYILIGDENKKVKTLGERTKVPIEVIPMALNLVKSELSLMGYKDLVLRQSGAGKHGPTVTESGNLIIDVGLNNIDQELDSKIKSIVGVIDTGLFIGFAQEGLISDGTKVQQILK